jgi:hypothetical protein
VRFPQIAVVSVFVTLLAFPLLAQSPNGTINGLVLDPSNRVIAGADVLVINDVTGVRYSSKTNNEGIYVVPNVPPGPYRLQVSKVGFKTLIKPDIVLNVQDALSINFTLPVGAVFETVTVEGGAPLVNTESATVSTVVDRQFVDNLPLNGRSFQTLIALTPGVVLTPVSSFGNQGQFSVNGQRTDANYFTVDGVSANFGVNAGGSGLYQSAGGTMPGLSVLGGTNSLISVDAMQEFRIQTSSFAPEFGSTPGGQVSIVSRSGTDVLHGTLFDYFRNDVLDANDWFANYNQLPKPEERQNDFGGVIGGPLIKERIFFFFSYEGLRLRQPLTQSTAVPSMASRQAAISQIQPFLNASPLPNGPDLGGGYAQSAASYSNPSSLDAYSIRADYVINQKLALFGRYSYSPSGTEQRGTLGDVLSDVALIGFSTHTLTLGLTQALAQNINNELRTNYSNMRVSTEDRLDSFGGAVPISGSSFPFPAGVSAANGSFTFLVVGGGSFTVGKSVVNEQRQANIVDTISLTSHAHQLKFGIDYRWLAPIASPAAYAQVGLFLGLTGPAGAISGTSFESVVDAFQEAALLSRNLSVFGQDTWKVTPRLTLTYGARWSINPALKGKNRTSEPFTVLGLDNPAAMVLAPRGTALYKTSYGSVAPRLGIAYELKHTKSWESVLRGGVGLFYDLGTGSLGGLTAGFPFEATTILPNVPFPLTPQQGVPPALTVTPPVTEPMSVAEPNLKLPRNVQWNVTLEQGLGIGQSVSATYIGSDGVDLLRTYALVNPNPDFSALNVTTNSGISNYQALQLKFQRRLSRGLQALVSYTFSHSIDNASDDFSAFTPSVIANPNVDRGNSDFDVRHSVTGAVIYDVAFPGKEKITRAIFGGWSLESFVMARSALTSNITGATFFVDGVEYNARPDIVPGNSFYLFGPQYPGGKAFNPAAFSGPPSGQEGNLGRNVLRGLGAWQTDLALIRRFSLTQRVSVQFRSEFFNVFNHPNFGNPLVTTLGQPLFGISTAALASTMGSGGVSGGFNPLYQVGGPRSIQLALKLQF